jgi:glycosyltransferase involved in cell wall biosynthesis
MHPHIRHPQVSVIIPCYRCADTIERALVSVLQQTLAADEVILVEDCSADNGATLAVLQSLQAAHGATSIKVVALQENMGPGGARNAGWEIARSAYIAFLDADDSWHPRKLEIQLTWMQAHPEAILSAGKSIVLQAATKPGDIPLPVSAHRVKASKLLRTNCLPTRAVMLRREIELRFDSNKRYAEDYLLWLRVALRGLPVYVIDAPLAFSYKAEYGESGLTGNLWKMERGEIEAYQSVCKQGLITKLACTAHILYSLLKFARRLALSVFKASLPQGSKPA